MKKMFAIFTLIVFSVFLVACDRLTLDAPVISIDQGVVSWDAVDNADSYAVLIDQNDAISVNETSYDLKQENLAAGTYSITVVAYTANLEEGSLPSNAVTYTVEASSTSLDAPDNLAISSSDILSWDQVNGATSYVVMVDSDEHQVSTNSFDLGALSLSDGSYQVSVIAKSSDDQSQASTALTYVVGSQTVVDQPQNLVITEDTLTWDQVDDATSYEVMIDGQTYTATNETFDLDALSLAVGSYQVTVKAINGSISSSASTAVTYTVVADLDMDSVYATTLSAMDQSYVPNMTVSDFEYEYEYDMYERATDMAEFYTNTASELDMSTEDANGFIVDAIRMMKSNPESLTDFMSDLGLFETYHMTEERVVELLYGLAQFYINEEVNELSDELNLLQTELTQLNADLETLKLDATFKDTYDLLISFTTSELAVSYVDKMFFDGQNYSYLNTFISIGYDVYVYGELTENAYLFVDDQAAIDIYENLAIAINTDQTHRELLNDSSSLFNAIAIVDMKATMISQYEMMIEEMQSSYDMAYDLEMLLETDKTENMEALEALVTFLFTVKNSVPEQVLTLIDDALSGESVLSPTEILLIKDELIDVLQEAMPDEEAFAAFRTMQLSFASIAGIDLSGMEAYVDYLGEVDHAQLSLMLLFIEDFDAMDYLEVMNLMSNLATTDLSEDPGALLDVAAYIFDYIDAFNENHAAEVAAYATLMDSENREVIYELMLEQIIVYAQNNDLPEESIYILETLSDQYDELMILMDAIETLGMDVIDELIESELAIYQALMAISMAEPEDMVVAISDLLDELDPFIAIALNDLSESEMDALLQFIKIPAVIVLSLEFGYEIEDANNLVESLIPYISERGTALLETTLLFFMEIDEAFIVDFESNLDVLMYGNPEDKKVALINIFDLFRTYIVQFELEHSDQVDVFIDAFFGENSEVLYGLIISTAIDFVENREANSPWEEQNQELILYVLNDYLTTYDEVMVVLEMAYDLPMSVLAELTDSEAAILDILMDMQYMDMENEYELLAMFEELFDEVAIYSDIFDDELGEAEIDALLTLIKPIAVISLYFEDQQTLNIEELDLLLEGILNPLGDIIDQANMIKSELVTLVDAIVVDDYYGMYGYTESYDLAIYLMILDTLDAFDTVDNQLLVTNAINTFYDSILSDHDVQTYLDMTQLQVDAAKANTLLFVDEMFNEVETLIAYDFNQLTEEEIGDIEVFMMDLGLYIEMPMTFEEALESSEVLVLSETQYIDVELDEYYYQFTASSLGYYRIYSTGTADPFVDVLDSDFGYFASGDDEDGLNFDIEFMLDAGETIYFNIYFFDELVPFEFVLIEMPS